MWDKFYKRTVNAVAIHRDHHLAEKKKNPNFNATYNLYGFDWAFKKTKAWFVASIPFINGLVDEDMNAFVDDYVGVSKDNDLDGQHELGYEDERVYETLVDEDRNVFGDDSLGVLKDNAVDGQHQLEGEVDIMKLIMLNQPGQNVSIMNFLPEVRALRKDSTCARPDMHNAEVACDGMSIDKADGKNEYTYSQRNPGNLDVLIEACTYSNKHPELDVFQHDNFVDRSVPKLNQTSHEHQPIDELIDGQKDTSLLQENVKNLSRPDGCERDKVTVPDEISEYLRMQDSLEYQFPLGIATNIPVGSNLFG
ncbi:hypothetical protein Tco_1057628 [Tanacetum coccineum]|uniref:Uncharacterized protein n=1 Tax=Tanacetum coccineum TaxID=301880 RepID=A0ABQ5H625_9ASTR